VALGLPVRNQTLYVDRQNDVFFSIHNDRFLFSGETPIFHAEYLMSEPDLETLTEITCALAYHAENEWIH
jgi:hypothetical protein